MDLILDRLMALKQFFKVDKRMVPSKIAYVLYGCYFGSYDPFLNLFFVSVGLSVSKAGIITGLMYAPPIITGPLWGYFADRTGRRRLILLILCVGSALLLSSMPWVAHAIMRTDCNVTSISNSSYNTNTSDIGSNVQRICGHRNESQLFWLLLVVAIAASLFLLPLPNYMETIVMNVVKANPKRSSYGGQRVMGAIGMSVTGYFAGKAADNYNEPGMSSYTAVFLLFLPVAILFFPIGCLLISQGNYDSIPDTSSGSEMRNKVSVEEGFHSNMKATTTVPKRDLNQILYSTFLRSEVVYFLLIAFISGIANSTFGNFTYLRSRELFEEKSKTEMTYIFVIANASEIILYPFASKLILILGGPLNSIMLGIFSYFVRFLVMSFDVSFATFVAIQLTNAFSFALLISAFMEYIHIISPPEIKMTMNALMMIIQRGAGGLVVNILGGKIYEIYGSRKLFFGVSQICLSWTVIMMVQCLCTKFKTNKKQNTHKEEYES